MNNESTVINTYYLVKKIKIRKIQYRLKDIIANEIWGRNLVGDIC